MVSFHPLVARAGHGVVFVFYCVISYAQDRMCVRFTSLYLVYCVWYVGSMGGGVKPYGV